MKKTHRPSEGEIEDARQAATDKGRAQKAFVCLYNLILVAKSQADTATWLNEGGQDLEDFFDALHTGANHPLLGHCHVIGLVGGDLRP